jgi:uncharacterized UBP type Zn finger protein
MEYIHRKETSRGQLDPSQVFRFQLEEKLVCGASGHVRYTQFSENMLSLTISSEMAANEMEVRFCMARVIRDDVYLENIFLLCKNHSSLFCLLLAEYSVDYKTATD